LFAWYKPVFKTNEDVYVQIIGMDAAVFLRFARMCRNMFCVLAVVGCAIVLPVNVTQSAHSQQISKNSSKAIILMTPRDLPGEWFWMFVAMAYVFNVIVCGFLWWTYRAVHRLRRKYMDGAEYQNSLHARTCMYIVCAVHVRRMLT
jgi:hypothetical protein